MRKWLARVIDSQARWLTNWLYSRAAFVQLVYGTLGWIPLVVFGIDKGGFLYLYIATSISLITQNPLAMLGKWAATEARRSEETQIETMKLIVALTQKIMSEQEAQTEQLEEQGEELDEIRQKLQG